MEYGTGEEWTWGKLHTVKDYMNWLPIDRHQEIEIDWNWTLTVRWSCPLLLRTLEKQRMNGVAFIGRKYTAKSIFAIAAEEEETEEFYDQVQSEINRTCKEEVLFAVGY